MNKFKIYFAYIIIQIVSRISHNIFVLYFPHLTPAAGLNIDLMCTIIFSHDSEYLKILFIHARRSLYIRTFSYC